MSNLYAVELNTTQNVTYVKGKEGLYLHSTMHNAHNLTPYLDNERGVYLLVGGNTVYVGEGDVAKRLTRHKATKLWVEDVYVYIGNKMTKEDSLQYEGAFLKYVTNHSNYDIDNKDGVRENTIDVSHHIQKFQWLGLTLPMKKVVSVVNVENVRVVDVEKTHVNTYKIVTIYKENLQLLDGLEFKTLNDVYTLVNSIRDSGGRYDE